MTAVVPGPARRAPIHRVGPRVMRVSLIRQLTETVTHFRFETFDGSPLPPYSPGSHVVVTAGGFSTACSLVDDGWFPKSYGISVLRRGEGSGSDWLHRNLAVGDHVEIDGPRSMFPLVAQQQRALLVAGGIGVTAILSHARAMARNGIVGDIVYSHRPDNAPHLDDLKDVARSPAIRLHEVTSAQETADLLAELLDRQPPGTHAYACAPPELIAKFQDLAARAGLSAECLHTEYFGVTALDAGAPFSVRLASTGEVLEVPAGVSLLDRLAKHGVPVETRCGRGVCGECRIPVISGSIDHRDVVLSPEERRRGDSMLCCVSRGTDLELDL